MFGSGLAFAGLARAEKPEVPVQNPGAVNKVEDESAEIQHLREARKDLNHAKDVFEKDPVDKADHRKEILEGIDKAIKAIDDEIDELKGGKK
jgi:soluble cytochrome b562